MSRFVGTKVEFGTDRDEFALKPGPVGKPNLSWSSLPLFLAALAQPNKTPTQVNKFRDGFKATNEALRPRRCGREVSPTNVAPACRARTEFDPPCELRPRVGTPPSSYKPGPPFLRRAALATLGAWLLSSSSVSALSSDKLFSNAKSHGSLFGLRRP
jgi:hypothetical protein